MKAFSETVYAIHSAALSPDRWPAALDKIGRHFDAEGAVLLYYRNDPQPIFISSDGVSRAVDIYISEEWWKRDSHAHRALEMNLKGLDVLDDYAMFDDAAMATLPIYTDFFQKVGFGWLMLCVLLPGWDSFVSLSVPRRKERGPYTPAEQETLGLFGRHVELALRLSLQATGGLQKEGALTDALDAIDAGVFLLGDDRRVLFTNRAGSRLIGTVFDQKEGVLQPGRADDRAAFEALLRSENAPDREAPPRAPCLLTGLDGHRVAVRALPVVDAPGLHLGMKDTPTTLLLVAPFEHNKIVDPVILRDLLDLTLGEARLTSLIGADYSVQEAARHLGITTGTARNVLKQVFRKLGVSRQVQLAVQIANLRDIVREPQCAKNRAAGASTDLPHSAQVAVSRDNPIA